MRSQPPSACTTELRTRRSSAGSSPQRRRVILAGPVAVTSASSIGPLESGRWPLTSSSPVAMTAIRGMRRSVAVLMPEERRVASSGASISVAPDATSSPGAMWEPRRRMWSRDGRRWMVTVSGTGPGPGATLVSSTGMMRPSKPSGTAAPVMMRTAVPNWGRCAGAPAGTSPITRSEQGSSRGRVRKPSMAELSFGGTALRAVAASARTRPACTGTVSTGTGRMRA